MFFFLFTYYYAPKGTKYTFGSWFWSCSLHCASTVVGSIAPLFLLLFLLLLWWLNYYRLVQTWDQLTLLFLLLKPQWWCFSNCLTCCLLSPFWCSLFWRQKIKSHNYLHCSLSLLLMTRTAVKFDSYITSQHSTGCVLRNLADKWPERFLAVNEFDCNTLLCNTEGIFR